MVPGNVPRLSTQDSRNEQSGNVKVARVSGADYDTDWEQMTEAAGGIVDGVGEDQLDEETRGS